MERVDTVDDHVLVYLKEVRLYTMYSQTVLLCAAAHAFGLAGSQRCPHELQSAAESEFRLQESQVSGDQSL